MKKYITIGILCTIIGLLGFFYGILIENRKFFPYWKLINIKEFIEQTLGAETDEIAIYESEVESLISVNRNNVDSLRKELIKIIFGYPYLPESQPDTIYRITDKNYDDFENLDYIEQFEITQRYKIQSIGYIFHPKKPNNRLMLYHQGHRGYFIIGKKALKQFIKEGFIIYAFSMPLTGKNNNPIVKIDKIGTLRLRPHEHLMYLENPIQYFIRPVITMINYSLDKKFDDLTMVGFSGGGWTTTLVAAMDSRINYSFPISGTLPLFIRLSYGYLKGGAEELYEKLYKKVNYLDMYILGSVGANRFQVQMLTKLDRCCFDGTYYKYYFPTIKSAVDKFDHGKFDVFIDSTHRDHKISKTTIMKISEIINSTHKNADE